MPSHKSDIIEAEPISFDEAVKRALAFCDTLPREFAPYRRQLAELQTRLSGGRLHFAVLGQFNRGKSTFINALLGINALPASVLPLTSVPTVIEYGTENGCRIRFTDGKADLAVSGAELIESTLRQYVAEENNPKNKFNVRDAVITCASELLANGTVLIDTPGFGSTHIHNTQTTLDLLVECDAALFLLSADPPMTLAEMEFLTDVKERVPKIFFALNKVDLLSKQGLDEVDKFIRGIIRGDLGFPIDTALYHTSAIRGLSAKKRGDDDPDWAASGLEAVRREVLDFMVREKYFTLADALRAKYGEAMTAIGALLEKRLGEKTAPAYKLRKETDAITDAIQSLSLELEKQLKKCAESREAINAAILELTNDNMESYKLSMKKALGVLTSGRYFPAEAASVAAAMLPKHSADLGAHHLYAIIERANKSIRAIMIRHAQTFSILKKTREALVNGEGGGDDAVGTGYADDGVLDRFEISADASAGGVFDTAQWDTPPPHIADMFRKKALRFETIRRFYEPLCEESIAKNIENANKLADGLVSGAWEKTRAHIGASYGELIDRLNAVYAAKRAALGELEESIKAETAFLKDRIRELARHSF